MTRARSLTLVAAVLAPVAVSALLSLTRGLITNNNAALVLVLVVVAVAATGYRLAGLVAAVVSAAAFDFFLTQPYLDFAISERDDIEAAVLLALIGLAVTEIALWGRRQQARASTRAGYLDGVVSAARLAASGGTFRPTSSTWSGDRSATSSTSTPARSTPARPTPTGRGCRPTATSPGGPCRRRRAGGTADTRRHRAGRDSAGVERGRYLLTSTSAVRRPDRERRQVAVTLADQAAAALAHGTATPRCGSP